MSFQVRHKEFGVYQGACMGLGFWHPMSDMPEQGFCEFFTRKDAQEFINFLCSKQCDHPLNRDDLSIERYNEELSEKLQRTIVHARSEVVH